MKARAKKNTARSRMSVPGADADSPPVVETRPRSRGNGATRSNASHASPHARTRRIRILCVDDHDFLLEGLTSRLTMEYDIDCVGQVHSLENLMQEVERTRPHIILLDIEMPGGDPFDALDTLRRRFPDIRVIMLTAYVRDHYVDEAFDKGAWGYFAKQDSPNQVIEGIRKVMRGEYALSATVLQRVDAARNATNSANGRSRLDGEHLRSRIKSLTPREMQVLRLIGKGLSRAEIAGVLCRSPKTIDIHNTNIMKKMGIHNRLALMRFAIGEGLVEV